MINIKELSKEPQKYIDGFAKKGMNLDKEVNEVKEIYSSYLLELQKEQDSREKLNKITEQVKKDPQNNDLKQEAASISSQAKESGLKANELLAKAESIASYFPQIPLETVKVGKDETENTIISTHHDELKDKVKNPLPQWELIEKERTLTKEASDISGARHVIYNDKSAQVIKAIEKLMLDTHIDDGVKLVDVPVIVNKEAMYNTGQLPKFEEDLFKLENGQYLIPTAEVPVTNLVANKILKEEELPIRYTATTQCFRSEAGSAGRDTRGIIRLHQFRKVELVTIGKAGDEEKDFNSILNLATSILDKLKLPYRLVELCTGDTSFASERTIDIEVWMPGVNKYREISSVSRFDTFQSRRMKARYKDSQGNKQLVKTYNGSGLAIGRTFAAIVENYQDEEGNISVPEALKPYLSFDKF